MECKPRHSPVEKGRTLGFTLVETAVSLLILAIGLAVVAPALLRTPPPAESCVRALRGALDRARWTAARGGHEMEVRLGVPGGRKGADWLPGALGCEGAMLIRVRPPGAAQIRFSPMGRASGGTIEVVDEGSVIRSIHVDGWTGSVHVDP